MTRAEMRPLWKLRDIMGSAARLELVPMES